ncbi:uncharacterized protein LOC128198262 [Bicyclus anynana]|uniref:Uncharacterized protein LOC128198262 n=1 Tax=Bicyclus anynana TaxID=110368 RepID=A0ABM3LHM2_BICAN|nr:uncharacterized protein LOC128198262 [Bicyclus anynana]
MDLEFICLTDQEQVNRHNQQALKIFTDGSKIDEKVGAALSLWNSDAEIKAIKLSLSSYCSVYQAELLAICKATKIILESRQKSFGIYSDSRSALETVANNASTHHLAVKSRANIKAIKLQNKEISLFWIKAHAGLDGNERADTLAKDAARKRKKKPDYDLCPISFVKREIRKDSLQKWNQRYKTGETAGITKIFFPDVLNSYNIIRKLQPTYLLTQIFTGHGGFAEYLHRYKRKDCSGCVYNETTKETIPHLILNCPQHDAAREDLQQELQMNLSRDSIPTIIKNISSRDVFIKFCHRVGNIAMSRNRADNKDT